MSTNLNQTPKKANPHDAALLIQASADRLHSPLLDLTQRVAETRCTVDDARVHAVGSQMFVVLLASGSWDAVAKLESQLSRINSQHVHQLSWQRHDLLAQPTALMPYMIEVVCPDKPGVVFELAAFFERQRIHIESLTSSKYHTTQGGLAMFHAQISVGVPSDTHIAGLRDEFLEFCDHLNLDAAMDPLKY